jgi:hypothetical protein
MRSEVLISVILKIAAFLNLKNSSLTVVSQHFNGMCWFYLQCRRLWPAWKVVVQIKVGGQGTVVKARMNQ